jgi:hypothetical protein
LEDEEMTVESGAPRTLDQLAELHVAGLFAESGWNVYFPHRDKGFDFIAVKLVSGSFVIRPVQVKGKYPEAGKNSYPAYGYVGKLTQTHPEMVLAIPYFESGAIPVLKHVAFMPLGMVRSHSRGYRCQPAKFLDGSAFPRGDHAKFFDHVGLSRVETRTWTLETLADDELDSSDGALTS